MARYDQRLGLTETPEDVTKAERHLPKVLSADGPDDAHFEVTHVTFVTE